MKITFEIDTTVPLSTCEKVILASLLGDLPDPTAKAVSIPATDTRQDTVYTPSLPPVAQQPTTTVVTRPSQEATLSHTDVLIPAETVSPASQAVPTMDQMRAAITNFVAHPHCGGTAAMKGILKRYGATGLTGASPVPPDRYTELHEELLRLIRLAPPF